MESSDVVAPGDAALHKLLGEIADMTRDPERRATIRELMVMLPPIADWPMDFLDEMKTLHAKIRELRRDLQARQLEEMFDDSKGTSG